MIVSNHNPDRPLTNCEIVRDHLQRVGHISPGEALLYYGIVRLAPRILELRQQGFSIKTSSGFDASGTRYTRYTYARVRALTDTSRANQAA